MTFVPKKERGREKEKKKKKKKKKKNRDKDEQGRMRECVADATDARRRTLARRRARETDE